MSQVSEKIVMRTVLVLAVLATLAGCDTSTTSSDSETPSPESASSDARMKLRGVCSGYLMASGAALMGSQIASMEQQRVGQAMFAIGEDLSKDRNPEAWDAEISMMERMVAVAESSNPIQDLSTLKAAATVACSAFSVTIPGM
jgi:hypothetical protein